MPDVSAILTSRSNPRVKELRASLSGKASAMGDLLGIEGLQLVGELHNSGGQLETVFVREGSESALEVSWPRVVDAKETVMLSRDAFDSAVSTATPQGIAATWRIRDLAVPRRVPPHLFLLLENLQDPGNLGTLLRSAEAFGVSAVLVTETTANQWNPKVLRSSAGSVFRVPVVRDTLGVHMERLQKEGARTFAAVSAFLHRQDEEGRTVLADATDFSTTCAIIIGNEGAGLSEQVRRIADYQVRIPCLAESLNAAVAGSVLMYEAMRQRSQGEQRRHGHRESEES